MRYGPERITHFNKRVFGKAALMTAGIFLLGFFLPYLPAQERLSFEKFDDGRVSVRADGKLFAQYRPNVAGTPILWPVLSSEGTLMTRSYPMIETLDASADDPELQNIYKNAQNAAGCEMTDHPHQRSIWFTHGAVNGADFWAIEKKTLIRSDVANLEKTADDCVVLTLHDQWLDEGNDRHLCDDVRTITFGLIPGTAIRFIDYDVEVTASENGAVFEDTKEGTFGVRTAGTLDVDAVNRNPAWGGKILNAEGFTDGDAWAKRSGWVAYSGPLPKRLTDEELAARDGEDPNAFPLTAGGIVVMNHPDSFRYPSWYHVRTYGLFAVNPFGIKDFEPNLKLDGSAKLAAGEKIAFRYRVLLYDGTLSAEEIAAQFDLYCQKP